MDARQMREGDDLLEDIERLAPITPVRVMVRVLGDVLRSSETLRIP
jgi:hypothetical protein